MQELKTIRVMLAEDHAIVREGLRSLLEKKLGMEIVCEVDDGRMAVEQARELSPDVVIMDISMTGMNGIEATRQIINNFPQTKVIALSGNSNTRFVADMLEAGAKGYVLKECLPDELVHAIQVVADGENYLSPKITGVVVEDYLKCLATVASSQLSNLTIREREVLQLVAEGKSTKQIASDLNVSTKTVEAHRHRTMEKLNAHTIADLVKIAIIENLVALE